MTLSEKNKKLTEMVKEIETKLAEARQFATENGLYLDFNLNDDNSSRDDWENSDDWDSSSCY